MTQLPPTHAELPPLTFTPEAEAELAISFLAADQRDDLEVFLRQARWQQRLWHNNLAHTSDPANDGSVAQESLRAPITLQEVRDTVAVVLDPERLQKRRFLNDLLGADGDSEATLAVYEGRDAWEKEHSQQLTITDADAAPYQWQIGEAFRKIVTQVKGNFSAQAAMKRLLDDFETAPAIKLKPWLIRMIINTTAPDDDTYSKWSQAVREDPERANELIDAFLNGGASGLTPGVRRIGS